MSNEQLTVDLETADIIRDAGAETCTMCFQCAQCSSNCPWNRVAHLDPRRMLHKARLGVADLEDEEWWMCATCRTCVARCPMEVDIIGVMRAVRRLVVGYGAGRYPDSIRLALKSIAGAGNPAGESPDKRAEWSTKTNIPPFTSDMEVLYFSCCIPAYDAKVKRMATNLSGVLQKTGATFGTLGKAEKCCGESVRKCGNEQLFTSLAASNIEAFKQAGVKKVVVSSPHCYHTFKNEYPELGAQFEVLHYTQYLAHLAREGKLKFTKEIKKKVAYHDPCYLGRHSGVYDDPRYLLQSIPGIELVEMANIREDSICCGGGGGRVWAETKKGERFSELRIDQAADVGADILATCCPYCILMLDDSLLTKGKEEVMQVMDISELVHEAMG
jgi:Fe-S oxidoreductase